MKLRRRLLQFALKQIEKADGYEINEILMAVYKRHKIVYPDWELTIMALPEKNREEELEKMIEFLRRR